jgi:hypothetical protein
MYLQIENMTVGVHLYNVWQSKQKVNLSRVPTIMRFGVGYKVAETATISVETEKDLRMPAVFKGGLEYELIDELFLRCGISTGNAYQYTFGLGYAWNFITADFAFSNHKFLGYSPHVSISVKW